jgi:hypothetical protein
MQLKEQQTTTDLYRFNLMKEYKHSELTDIIIQSFYRVYNELVRIILCPQ